MCKRFEYPWVSLNCIVLLPSSTRQILDVCLRMGSKDNMTALVVKMDAQKIGEGGGVMARRQQREAEAEEENGKSDA